MYASVYIVDFSTELYEGRIKLNYEKCSANLPKKFYEKNQ